LAVVTIDLEARLAKLESGFDKAALLAQRNAQRIERAFGGVRTAISGAVGALAVALPAGFLLAATRNSLNAIDAFNDLKDATGASIENISALDDIARRTGGTFETAADTLVKFNNQLKNARPGDDTSRIFKALNLDVAELRRLDPAEALQRTAVALARYADDGGKARAIQELFGKSVREAAPFLKDLAEAGELSAKTTTQQAEAAEQLNKQLFRLEANATNAGRGILSTFVPALNAILEAFNKNGLIAALDAFEERIQRGNLGAYIKTVEADISKLERSAEALSRNVTARVERFGPPGRAIESNNVAQVEAELAKKRALLKELQRVNLGLSDGAAGGGRGLVNPEQVAPRLNVPEKIDTAGIDKARRAYADLIRTVTERITLQQSELDTGEKLGEQQRFALEVVTKLADAESRFTDVQKRAIAGELEKLLALDEGNRRQREQVELRERSLQIEQRGLDALAADAQRRIEANAALEAYVQEIGLSERQLRKLEDARLNEAIATEQQALAMARNAEASDAEIEARERNIRLLERQRDLRRQGEQRERDVDNDAEGGIQRAIDKYLERTGKLGTETERVFGGAIQSVEDGLVGLVKTGNDTVDALIQEFFRLAVVRPFLQQLLGLFGQGGGFGDALGSAVGSIGSFFGSTFGGFFERGGDMRRGRWNIVGENGPEIVAGPGTVINAAQASALMGGAATTQPPVIQYITFNGGVSRNEVIAGMAAAKNAALGEWADGARRGRWGN
jgi:hypothetical protein